MRRIPFLVAMPKSVIKPMMAGMLNMPDVSHTLSTPPINANGRFNKIMVEIFTFLNSWYSKKKITNKASSDVITNVFDASASASN